MCTLAIYLHRSSAFPVVVAANRDEFYGRPTLPPARIASEPDVVAGLDLQAGGTWFGTNEHGVTVGILNRRNPDGPDPGLRSRGLLCLELLQRKDLASAEEFLRTQEAAAYNWFNLVIATPSGALVAGNRKGTIAAEPLRPGLHVLTNLDLNDFTCPRVASSYARFDAVPLPDSDAGIAALVDELRAVLSDHTLPLDPRLALPLNTICIHTPSYGTRSSTIVVQRADTRAEYFHADGPPCTTPHEAVPLPWAG